MNNSITQIIETTITKAKTNPEFSKDLLNYVKYLVLESCPQERIGELDLIFKHGNLNDLLSFGTDINPDCNRQIINYVKDYS